MQFTYLLHMLTMRVCADIPPLLGAKGTEGTQRPRMRKRASERLHFCSGIWRILAEVISAYLPAEKENP